MNIMYIYNTLYIFTLYSITGKKSIDEILKSFLSCCIHVRDVDVGSFFITKEKKNKYNSINKINNK